MSDRFDLDDLLHPALAFEHPNQVLHDPDLTLDEKRAILASWASDACALEAAPELREIPGGARVRFDDIMDALRALDKEAERSSGTPSYRRLVREGRWGGLLRAGNPDEGRSLQ